MRVSELPKFDILPAGSYQVGIKEIKRERGKESGLIYLRLQFSIIGGEFAKRVLFSNLSLSPKALSMVRAFLEAIDCLDVELPVERGADGKYVVIDEDAYAEVITQLALGKELQVEINEVPEDKEKGFKPKNDVVAYSPCQARNKWDG